MGEWGDLGRLGDWAPKWVTELSRSLLRPPYGAFTASRNARPRGARRACHHAAPSAAALREGPDPGGEHRASSCAPHMCRSRRARTPPLTSGSLSMPPFTAPGQPIRPRRSPRPVRSDQDGVPRAGQDRGRRSVALRVAAGREGARDPGAAPGRSRAVRRGGRAARRRVGRRPARGRRALARRPRREPARLPGARPRARRAVVAARPRRHGLPPRDRARAGRCAALRARGACRCRAPARRGARRLRRRPHDLARPALRRAGPGGVRPSPRSAGWRTSGRRPRPPAPARSWSSAGRSRPSPSCAA